MKHYCENCVKKANCTRETGIIFGFCNADFKPAKLSFNDVVTRIAESYREDAEELNATTIAEVFKIYGYDDSDVLEGFIYSLANDFERSEGVEYDDDGNITVAGTNYDFATLKKAVKKYKFVK